MGDHPDNYPPTPTEPVRREVMRMWWLDLSFIHWRWDAEVVQSLLPPGLTVDTFDGDAWVGLVPFLMKVGLPGGVAIPQQGTFPETNVRTYVRGPDGTPGVWFCSLEAGRLAASATARLTYGLPYFWADMRMANAGPVWTYQSTRRWPEPGPRHSSAVQVGDAIGRGDQTPLERFLTARWGLFSLWRERLLYAPVDHPAWELHHAELLTLDDELVAAAGLPAPSSEPIVHWTPGVEVRIGRPRRA